MCGHVRSAQLLRQRRDQCLARLGGVDLLALALQKTAFEQQLDNTGTGGLGTQPIRVAQHLAQFRILHKTGNAGHRRQQAGIGERFWRLGHLFQQLATLTVQRLTHFQSRQLTFVLLLRLLAHQRLPARIGNLTYLGHKQATGNLHLNAPVGIATGRVELHQILAGDLTVNLQLGTAQPIRCSGLASGDDRMMRLHLLVVPCLGFEAQVGILHGTGQLRLGTGNRLGDTRRLGKMLGR